MPKKKIQPTREQIDAAVKAVLSQKDVSAFDRLNGMRDPQFRKDTTVAIRAALNTPATKKATP